MYAYSQNNFLLKAIIPSAEGLQFLSSLPAPLSVVAVAGNFLCFFLSELIIPILISESRRPI